MNNFLTAVLVTSLTLGSLAVRAADTAEERSELRQRAEEYQAQRARNPDFQPGQGRVAPDRAEMAPKRHKARPHRATKTKVKSAPSETPRTRAAKRARSLKKIPGAFVRR